MNVLLSAIAAVRATAQPAWVKHTRVPAGTALFGEGVGKVHGLHGGESRSGVGGEVKGQHTALHDSRQVASYGEWLECWGHYDHVGTSQGVFKSVGVEGGADYPRAEFLGGTAQGVDVVVIHPDRGSESHRRPRGGTCCDSGAYDECLAGDDSGHATEEYSFAACGVGEQ